MRSISQLVCLVLAGAITPSDMADALLRAAKTKGAKLA